MEIAYEKFDSVCVLCSKVSQVIARLKIFATTSKPTQIVYKPTQAHTSQRAITVVSGQMRQKLTHVKLAMNYDFA